eukprot:SM000435S15745  [mRNA]  locus=s435:22096:32272:- [translate_table: standard]
MFRSCDVCANEGARGSIPHSNMSSSITVTCPGIGVRAAKIRRACTQELMPAALTSGSLPNMPTAPQGSRTTIATSSQMSRSPPRAEGRAPAVGISVMHPSLVNTLKSIIITPASAPSSQSPDLILPTAASASSALGSTAFSLRPLAPSSSFAPSAFIPIPGYYPGSQTFSSVLSGDNMSAMTSGVRPTAAFSQPYLASGFSASPSTPLQCNALHQNISHVEQTLPLERNCAAVVPVGLIQDCRPFKCEQADCGRSFKNAQTLKMHLKAHVAVDDEEHLHDGYPNEALQLALLQSHRSSERAGLNKKIPSRCPECDKTFVGLYELRRHFGRKHSQGDKTYTCRKCAKGFFVKVDMRDHEKMCGETIECNCGMRFAFKCNLVAHKKQRPACQDSPPEDSSPSPRCRTRRPLGKQVPRWLQKDSRLRKDGQDDKRTPASAILHRRNKDREAKLNEARAARVEGAWQELLSRTGTSSQQEQLSPGQATAGGQPQKLEEGPPGPVQGMLHGDAVKEVQASRPLRGVWQANTMSLKCLDAVPGSTMWEDSKVVMLAGQLQATTSAHNLSQAAIVIQDAVPSERGVPACQPAHHGLLQVDSVLTEAAVGVPGTIAGVPYVAAPGLLLPTTEGVHPAAQVGQLLAGHKGEGSSLAWNAESASMALVEGFINSDVDAAANALELQKLALQRSSQSSMRGLAVPTATDCLLSNAVCIRQDGHQTREYPPPSNLDIYVKLQPAVVSALGYPVELQEQKQQEQQQKQEQMQQQQPSQIDLNSLHSMLFPEPLLPSTVHPHAAHQTQDMLASEGAPLITSPSLKVSSGAGNAQYIDIDISTLGWVSLTPIEEGQRAASEEKEHLMYGPQHRVATGTDLASMPSPEEIPPEKLKDKPVEAVALLAILPIGLHLAAHLPPLCRRSSYMRRGERQPMASQGDILHEKLAPYKLSLLVGATLPAWLLASETKHLSLASASFSPPTR